MYRAMIDKDTGALEDLLGEEFVLVHMTGMRQDRSAFLRAVEDGTLNYFCCEDDVVEVALRGDAASITGKSRVEAAVFGSGRHTWRLRQDLTLARRDGRWRIVRSRASTY